MLGPGPGTGPAAVAVMPTTAAVLPRDFNAETAAIVADVVGKNKKPRKLGQLGRINCCKIDKTGLNSRMIWLKRKLHCIKYGNAEHLINVRSRSIAGLM